ncbi:MAG: helix-turn-helix transcriptional regulator [Oscillospiraceae bacterium]|nr:helix-turn-helix transcriptional regulator [Oscillospiraceae bacterium]MBR2640756.1 helix-turn-helix transcriptional regulator [Oscillospiraceae bacterium]MBR6657140.1 helix-turn-helix transcriptional regulator [Oscillospiraceae bacterium]
MSIEVNLDVMLAKRKMSMTELSEKVGITMANLSILKTGKAKAIRFSTLEAICEALDCQPGDILTYKCPPCLKGGVCEADGGILSKKEE